MSVLTGNAKIAQLKELERYTDYTKEGNKFVFAEVYEKPLKKIDNRKGNSGKSEGSRSNVAEYIETIEKLILNLLTQDSKWSTGFGKVFLSKNCLLKEFEMINDNYVFCKERIPKLSKFMDISEENVSEYFDTTNDLLERNLECALKSLESQCLILWSREITVVEAILLAEMSNNTGITRREYIDTYGEKVVNYNYYADDKVDLHHREGTDEEKKFIIHTEKEIMKELSCKNKQFVIKMGMWNNFKEKVNKIVLEELNIAYYYKSYKILFNEDHISEAIEDIYDEFQLSKDDMTMKQYILNKSLIERSMINTEKRHDKAIDEKSKIIGNLKDSREHNRLKRRSDENYISDNNKLNDTLIVQNAINIVKDVKKTKLGMTKTDIEEIDNMFKELDMK